MPGFPATLAGMAGSRADTSGRWRSRVDTTFASGSKATGRSDEMGDTVYLKQMELGPMQNFVYLIGDPETRECVVVDPAWEIDAIVDQVEQDGMQLRGALVTHTHQDHVGGHLFGFDIPGIEELLARVPVKVYVHKAERE